MSTRLCEKCTLEDRVSTCAHCPYPGDSLMSESAVATFPADHSSCYRLKLATSFWQRLRGLLGRKPGWLSENEVLVLTPCNSIHTWGMRHKIDVAFIGKGGEVLRAHRGISPKQHLSCRKAVFVIERFSSIPTRDSSGGERTVNACNWLNQGDFLYLCTHN